MLNEATELLGLAVVSVSNPPVEEEGPFTLLQKSTFRPPSSNHALSVTFSSANAKDTVHPSIDNPSPPSLVERRVEMAS